MSQLISTVLIGIAAGWLSGQILKGRGFGLLGDLVVGVVGAAVGSYAFAAIGLSAFGLIGKLITATVGALVLLFAIKLIQGNHK